MHKKKVINVEKGSISVYAIATVLCFLLILSSIFCISSTIRENQLKTLLKIKEIYAEQIDQLDEIAEKRRQNSQKVANNLGVVISEKENTDLTDSYGNKITIPAGFYIVPYGTDDSVIYSYDKDDDGTSTKVPVVQDGIVIQNATDGNQFVWVPVGDIKNIDGTTTTITLGRYTTFTVTDGMLPTPAQVASETDYDTPVVINGYFFEISDTFEEKTVDETTFGAADSYGNTKAINLQEWIRTTLANGGYYIARYEASQSVSDSTKAASKSGQTVWGNIAQPDAADAAKATYSVAGENKDNYYSDLVNSYAWDTAIAFIGVYAYYTTDNKCTSITTTGANEDQVCNINDLFGNACEWTTETTTFSNSYGDYPCTHRGWIYDTELDSEYSMYAYYRYYRTLSGRWSTCSFRITLYVQ